MARTKPAKTHGETSRKLTLSKETLKDLTAKNPRVKGGFIMRDTVIIPTSR